MRPTFDLTLRYCCIYGVDPASKALSVAVASALLPHFHVVLPAFRTSMR